MRQIFSVILAAALVFGGTLFIAGYFDGIAVRDDHARKPIANRDSETRITVWHCPEVGRILAGPLPEIFEDSFAVSSIDKSFKFYEVTVGWGFGSGPKYGRDGNSINGKLLTCEYLRKADLSTPRKMRQIRLSRAYDVRIEFSDDWRLGAIPDGGHVATCKSSVADCSFYVVEAEQLEHGGRH